MVIRRSITVCLLACLQGATCVRGELTSFVHPGIIFTSNQIETFRKNALSGQEPWATTYSDLQSNSYASSDYTIRGPGQYIGLGGTNSTITGWTYDWQDDCIAAYLNAVMYAITQDDAHAQKTADIVDAWSGELEAVVNDDNLDASLPGRQYVNAAEIVNYVRGSWPSGSANFARAQSMVSKALVPYKDAYAAPPSQPVPGGNQAFLGRLAGIDFAIFTNNVTGYNAELDIILGTKTACSGTQDSGMMALLQNVTGQPAEAGRDQGHSADEIGWIEEAAQVVANQGVTAMFDIVSNDGNKTPLLALAMEYYYTYNLGGSVPFDKYWAPCCCGDVDYQQISNISRGGTYVFGEIGYRYYSAKGVSLPMTEKWLEAKRPLEITNNIRDWLAWTTLTWATGSI